MATITTEDDQLFDIALRSLFCSGDARSADAQGLPKLKRGLLESILDAGVTATWREATSEITGGGGPSGSMGMMLVRKRERLVYSVKPSNFLRDPFISTSAAAMLAFAACYGFELTFPLPATFPGFLIGVTFTVLRSLAHPVSYGEAALLHHMNHIQEERGLVPSASLEDAGDVLAERYDYAKGRNGNEVASLLQGLVSWRSIEALPEGGYRIRESVPFGLGPFAYVDQP